MATSASQDPPEEYVTEHETSQSKGNSEKLLGCLNKYEVLSPEDSEANGLELYVGMWQDPFRMSVLDFQHRALDKLAEILKPFLNATKMSPEKLEDVQALIQCIKSNSKRYAEKLGYTATDLCEDCQILIDARNSFAHQKYVKGDPTPQTADPEALEKSAVRHKKPEFINLYKSTRTFEKTISVIKKCIKFSEAVCKYLSKSPMNDQTRQVMARCYDLNQLEVNFMQFIEYRNLERANLKAFHQSHTDVKTQKQVAQQVLAKLQSRMEEEDSSDLCQHLACVVAPRCQLKIDLPKPPRSKK